MKILLLSMVLLMGCGAKALMPDELPRPGFSWQPMPGVVISATDTPNLYQITLRCNAFLDFETGKISEEVLEVCEVSDYEEEAYYLISTDQIADLLEHKRSYWDK